ncbi:MAG TPA: hypothetical protein PKY78_06850 [Candidatus Omnitrophota bacterium]|nr:hypothetical protein [Candidatus Omnitrophota bacterium]
MDLRRDGIVIVLLLGFVAFVVYVMVQSRIAEKKEKEEGKTIKKV